MHWIEKIIVLLAGMLAGALAFDMLSAQQTSTQIDATIDARIVDNVTGDISADDTRIVLKAITSSAAFRAGVLANGEPVFGTNDGRIETRSIIAETWIDQAIARDDELPTASQLLDADAAAQLNRLPFNDCSPGQILKWTGSAPFHFACDADATGSTGSGLDAAGVRAQIGAAAVAGAGITRTSTGSGAAQVFTYTADDSHIDGRVASWARANSPSGDIPEGTIPASIARDSEIASYARASGVSGTIPDAQIPSLDAGKIATGQFAAARIPNLNGNIINTGVVDARYIDNAITRDVEIPAVLFAGAAGWMTADAGDCLVRAAGAGATTRGSFAWNPCSGAAANWTLVHDRSYVTPSLARTNISTAATQLTITCSAIDPDHGITCAQNRIVFPSAGRYELQVSMRLTPNTLNAATPLGASGPHRIWPTFYIQRHRGAVNNVLNYTRQTWYLRGIQTGNSPASYYHHWDGSIVVNAADQYSLWLDATADSAHQADWLTVDSGEVEIVSSRVVNQ